MRIGLFFGSFNPIHLGHTALAEYILANTPLEQIWLVLSPNNPFKDPGTLMPEELRLQLATAALRNHPDILPCDREFTLPKPNYTVTTLRALSAEHPEHIFTLIIGSDNMARFDRWREWEYIVAHYPILVYPRQGDNIPELQRRFPTMQVIDAPLLNVSATDIRHRLQHGLPTNTLLDPEVEKLLKTRRSFLSSTIDGSR